MDDDAVGVGDLDGDVLGILHDDLVAVADIHNELLALLLNTVADAVDLELLLVALGNADHHIVDDGTGKSVQRAVELLIVRTLYLDYCPIDFNSHVGVDLLGKSTLGTLDCHNAVFEFRFDAGGNIYRFSSNSRHFRTSSYQMNARTSPPTFCLRASRSVITPLEVEMMAIPRPFMTLGISSTLL